MRTQIESSKHLRALLDANRESDNEIQITGTSGGNWVIRRIVVSPDSEGDGMGTYDLTNEKPGSYETFRGFLRASGVGAAILLGCAFHEDGK